MSIDIIVILICCGIFSNVMSALFGIGGGVLMVPVLMTIFPNFSIQMVAATSLSIVIGTALINLTYFIRQKISIDMKSLILWSFGMIIGVQLGFEISFFVSDFVIIAVFITTMLILSIKTMLTVFNKKENNDKKIDKIAKSDKLKGFLFCTTGGSIAGLTGIGGGSIMAPLVTLLDSVEHKQVAVYTNYMMVIGGLGSMYGYLSKDAPNYFSGSYQIGYINFSLISIVILSSFITSFFSMKLRGIMKKRTTNIFLSIILILIAIYTTIYKFL